MKSLLLILICVLSVQAQKQALKPCTLTLEQSPTLRGLKLEQPFSKLDEVLPRRGAGFDNIDEIGMRRELMSEASVRNPELLKGIMLLQPTYLDDKLASIQVSYDGSVEWQSDLHFTAAIAEQLHLPTDGWTGKYPTRLDCDGFSVETFGTRRLVIKRTGFDSEVSKREAAREQKKRVEFKP